MLKKSMDIIDVYSWVKICSRDLEGSFIDNIYRTKYSWALKLRCLGSVKLLKVETGVRIHFSRGEPSSKEIDNLTRYLRAHVREGKILSVEMPWWERVVVLKTVKAGKELLHYIELVPRGVWAITDINNKIIYANKFVQYRDREIKLGANYQPPPSRGEPPWRSDVLIKRLTEGKDLVRGIISCWGLPGYIAEEILLRAGAYAEKNKAVNEIGRPQLEQVIDEYTKLVNECLFDRGYLVYKDGALELYSPYRPRLFEEVYGFEVRNIGSFEEALDVYFMELEGYLSAEERRRQMLDHLESWRRRVEEQKKIVDEFSRKLEDIDKTLSLVYKNYKFLFETMECVKETREKRGWEAVVDCNISRYDMQKGVVYLNLDSFELAVPVREGVDGLVLKLEKMRGELKKKIKRASEVLKELETKSTEAEEELTKRTYTKIAPKYWYEKYRWSFTRGGYLVIAGRDASQNEAIVKKHLGDEDVFLHAEIRGAPATVLLKGKETLKDEDVQDAAVIAACYSRAWKAGYSYVDVYWVLGKQVSKSPPPGEFLGKGSFMIYGERTYLKIPLKLGVGLRVFCDNVYGDYIKVYVGHPDLVKTTAISYVVLVPAQESPEILSKKIANTLIEHAYKKTGIKYELAEQQVLEVLPGPARIVEEGMGKGESSCIE
ncbi:MAG: ribosome rescue protein RqcH [Desulfurococcaceae archaeon]